MHLVRRLLAAATLFSLIHMAHAADHRNWSGTRSHAPDVGEATPGAGMQAGEAMHVAVSLQVRDKAGLDSLADGLMAGTSSGTLTPEQFLARFAPTQAQVDAVVAHLSQSGYINIEVSPNRLLVTADGTAGTARAAFQVEMRHYTVQQRGAYANVNDPVVPASLANVVLAVHGLQTVHLARTGQARVAQQPLATAGKTGHSPTAWPAIYNAGGLPTAANTSIGIITAGDMTQTLADLGSFVRAAGYPAPVVSTVSTASRSRRVTSTTDNTAEWDIDSQNALGAAGGVVKSLIFYAAASLSEADLAAAYNAAVAANAAKVINVSLGECETTAKNSGAQATMDQIFKTAVAQGQTFVVASGDSGAYGCSSGSSAQSYPAASPYVIAVGGTSLSTTAAGAWSGETVWACATAALCINNGGTGGGASLTEAAPSWQIAAKVLGSSLKRGVPDIAFAGDPASGALTIVNGKTTQYGGTSLSAPIFAGFWARLQSARANKLAFPGAALYKFGAANQATLFHDVTSGANGAYTAAKGWDYASGFGSLNVGNFSTFISANSGSF